MLKTLTSLLGINTMSPTAKSPSTTQPPENRRKRRGENEFTTYYGRPVLKKPHWVWQIWIYFWLGGISGAASTIAAVLNLAGDKERDKGIIRSARYISMAGLIVSPIMLIWDLGRPERFHHMLRIVKFRSPLNLGTYILSTTAIMAGINTARQLVEDGFIPEDSLPGKLAMTSSNNVTNTIQGVAGLGLGSYTGVLLSSTAVPIWAEAEVLMGPLFLSSAFSTGCAAITLARAVSGADDEEIHRLIGLERTAMVSESSLLAAWYLKMPDEVRRPFTEGLYQKTMLTTVASGIVGPFLLQALGPKHGAAGRFVSILSTISVLIGGFILRYTVLEAGRTSSQDPDAYHRMTRGHARLSPEQQAAKAKPKAQG